MVSEKKLKKYASLAVRVGANVQRGQLLVIRCSVDAAYFGRLCAREAYEAGASRVVMQWADEQITKTTFEYEETKVMQEIFPWEVQRTQEFIDCRYAYLCIDSDTPGLLADIPSEKLQAAMLAKRAAFKKFDYYFSANHSQWCIVAIPTQAWAQKVFPQKSGEEAVEALWDAVLSSVRITEDNDPVAEWYRHNRYLHDKCDVLNMANFKKLHFKNNLGTDLTVGLVENHVWMGGNSIALDNSAFFNPNMPSEEVFTMPDRLAVEGAVYASKPLNYNGKMINGFWMRFENGKVVDYGAKEGADTLKTLVEFDEGSSYLGEVALIPFHSPISDGGILFLNTLFDENASCHLALGKCYEETIKGGPDMTKEELQSHGGNDSNEHCDFMFGSEDMHITGFTHSGEEISVFESGDFHKDFC